MKSLNTESLKSSLAYALFLGLYLACLDLLMSFSQQVYGLYDFRLILPPLATGAVFFFMITFPGYLIFKKLFRRMLNTNKDSSQAAFFIFISILFILARAFDLLRLQTLSGIKIIQILSAGLLAFVMTFWIIKFHRLFLTRTRSNSQWPVFKNTILILTIEAMLIVWILVYRFTYVPAITKTFFIFFLIALWGLSWFLMSRTKKSGLTTWISTGCILVSLILGLSHLPSIREKNRFPFSSRSAAQLAIKNIILITIDTLRSDHLSCYNDDGVRTPAIDQLADDGFIFENAYSNAPWTKPSFASMMTGHSPVSFEMNRPESRLPDTLMTIAEAMGKLGYYTAAIGDNYNLTKKFNFDQGFNDFIFYPKLDYNMGLSVSVKLFYHILLGKFDKLDITTQGIATESVQWLQENEHDNFFLWIHFLDPHLPYAPPRRYLPKTTPPPEVGIRLEDGKEIRVGMFAPDETEREWIGQLYRQEIRYVDDSIEQIMRTLKDLNLYEETLIVLTSDHGEEFWEHGSVEHGHTLYQELIHIPFIIKPSKTQSLETPQRFRQTVSLLSLFPTLLDVCRHSDLLPLPGPSLKPVWEKDETLKPMPVYCADTYFFDERECLIFQNYKYIRNLTIPGADEFYNLTKDPGEYNSLIHTEAPPLRHMQSIMDTLNQQAIQIGYEYGLLDLKKADLSEAALERLRSMGYLR